jgi:hypothetical protein
MMKTTELRIGNYIMDRGNKIWQIENWENESKVAAKEPIIGICDFTKKPIHGHPLTEEVDFLKPIPLTNEWFLKFGYVLKPWGYVKEGSPLIRFSLTPKEKYWVELGNGFRIDLPFVHTLQNLIQLTGTELTIKK